MLRSRHVPLFDEAGRLTGFGGLINLTSETDERTDETPLILERHMDFIRLSSDWMGRRRGVTLQMVTHRVNNVLGVTPHELIGKNLLSLMIDSEPLRDALKRRMDRCRRSATNPSTRPIPPVSASSS